MMSRIYRAKTIKKTAIADAPPFYKDASGNPYCTRLDNGIDTKVNTLHVVGTDSFDFQSISPSDTITRVHGLGYEPVILGTYKMTNATTSIGTAHPSELTGTVPEFRYPAYGPATNHEIYVAYIDKTEYQLYVFTGANSADYKFNLIFLTQRA